MNTGNSTHRGDVFIAVLNHIKGSEQAGRRPVIIVQNDIGNRFSPTTIVVPLTSKKKQAIPTHVRIKEKSLSANSTALCEQVTTISKDRLKSYVCTLGSKEMRKIDKALKISLGIGE